MSKQHRDFVSYVRNGVEINALVAFSRDVYTSATQTEPASSVEHLTVVYLDPNVGGGVPTGEALRNSIKIQMDVPPLTEGLVNGWKEVSEDAADAADAADKLSQANAQIEQQAEKLANADRLAVEQDKRIAELEATVQAKTDHMAAAQQGPGDPAAENQAATAPDTAHGIENGIFDRGEDLGNERFAVIKNWVQQQNFATREEAQAFIDKDAISAPVTE